MPVSHLPDPVRQPEFFASVTFKRAIAWIIDVVISIILTLPVLVMTFFTGVFFFPLILLAVGFLYRWFTIAHGSATWGMRLMSLELRDARGQRLNNNQALLHTALYHLFCIFTFLQVISVILMLTTQMKQGLHDKFLGTVLLNRRI